MWLALFAGGLLVLVTAVAVILAFRAEDCEFKLTFTKKGAPPEKEKLPRGKKIKQLPGGREAKYLR